MAESALAPMPEGWAERFWAKASWNDGCLEWQKARTAGRYGVHCTKALRNGKRQDYAHRIAYMLAHGPIPSGMYVCHTCDNPACINPEHLFLGTQLDNMRDWKRKNPGHPRRVKITNAQVEEMKRRYAAGGVTFYDLADKFGISFQHAHAVVRGTR